ncbi:threonine dehydratase [Stackebrandtia endophytica]|uniref:Threonine dehydratase n=1 Tax=Stackebrandtia endophytica TaxID=1496996 RepID=A0A543AQ34_9ACTN|nr:threonine/serine dehydratase [Stackebrandtia endophytica]TQL74668.1 threonine dehydratase [Stackebrandtia endophytica]
MELVTLERVQQAAETIADLAVRTPLIPAGWAGRLWLKPENLQPVGAFKIRGAANAVAHLTDSAVGVLTHSSGNHGRALGYVAASLGIPCVIVVPDAAPKVKIDAMRATGAEIVIVPGAERESTAAALLTERGMQLVPPYDDPDVIAGQGTVGLEILADAPDVDTVVIPVGGGGLASGVSTVVKALSPRTRVIGVEPELAADAADSLRQRHRVVWSPAATYRTIADGARTALSELTFAHIDAHVDEIVTISDDEIRAAVGLLARRSHLVAEPTGAMTTAAHLKYGHTWGRTVAVISGGNIEPSQLAELVVQTDPA